MIYIKLLLEVVIEVILEVSICAPRSVLLKLLEEVLGGLNVIFKVLIEVQLFISLKHHLVLSVLEITTLSDRSITEDPLHEVSWFMAILTCH